MLSRTAEGLSLNIVQDSSQNLGCNLKLDSVHPCDNYKSMLFIVIENFRPNKASLYHSSNIFQIFLSVSFNNNKNQFWLYLRIGILFPRGKNLHDHISSLRGGGFEFMKIV
jgi:hypothetical protein